MTRDTELSSLCPFIGTAEKVLGWPAWICPVPEAPMGFAEYLLALMEEEIRHRALGLGLGLTWEEGTRQVSRDKQRGTSGVSAARIRS